MLVLANKKNQTLLHSCKFIEELPPYILCASLNKITAGACFN